MSCTSQIAYDMAWKQQISKESESAENNRLYYLEQGLVLTGGSSTNPFFKEPNIARPKIAPHVITGWIPIESKYQEQRAEYDKMNLTQYSGGLPNRGIYTRRNNPQALEKLRAGKGLGSTQNSFFTRYNVAHPKFPQVDHNTTPLMTPDAIN